MSGNKNLGDITQIPSYIVNELVNDFTEKIKPLDTIQCNHMGGLGTTRSILENSPNKKEIIGDLDLITIAKQNNRESVETLKEWAHSNGYSYQVAFGNIFSVGYPYKQNKYQIDLMIAKPSDGNVVYDYMRKFKHFSDENPNQNRDFIIKGAHRSELIKTIVKAMGLSATEHCFKQFRWNNTYNDMDSIVEILNNRNSRFRNKEKKQQTSELIHILEHNVKDIETLKKHVLDGSGLIKNRYPNSLFKKVPIGFDVMIDTLFDREDTTDVWYNVLDEKFQTSNTIQQMNTFDSSMNLIKQTLKKRLITPRSILFVFNEIKNNFKTGRAAGEWNSSLEEYIEKQFTFLKNRW